MSTSNLQRRSHRRAAATPTLGTFNVVLSPAPCSSDTETKPLTLQQKQSEEHRR
ncbi:uncharacterized protein G2W53_035350 [Senna tora]|uniref:Uncharacterized protein n=1 Tax=Senna tora TaxID=362788 RepID=A0A834SVL6_9FABA|nr:uncharacterized protein G2W53_035350 [Senna tora]